MTATDLDGADDGTVGDSDGSVYSARRWRRGSHVYLSSDLPLLDGAWGRVVAVGLPGPNPVRVKVARPGLYEVDVRLDELRAASARDPDARFPCMVQGCRATAVYLTDACAEHLD